MARNLVWIPVFCLAAALATPVAGYAADDNLTKVAPAALIEELVLTESDTFLMEGRSYVSREASMRINGASGRLIAAGKNAWPLLFAHRQDKRESTPSAEVLGPHDVGQKCYYILKAQVIDLPPGYPYSKLLASNAISFRPTMEVWLTQRQDRSLDEIRYEVLGTLLDMEIYANESKAVDLLRPHLEKVEERIKFANRGKLQRESLGSK